MNRAERRRQAKGRSDAAREAALKQLREGRPARAAQLFEKIAAKDPRDGTALHFAGIANYKCRKFEEAAGLFSRAIEIAPGYAEAHNSYGIMELETSHFADAVKHFERAVGLKPEYANAHANLGDALRGLDDISGAAACYRRALDVEPRHIQAAYKLAAASISLNQAAVALEISDYCISIDPFCQHGLACQALALQMLGRKDDARELYDFERLVHHAPLMAGGLDAALNDRLEEAVRNEPSLTWEPLTRVTKQGAVTDDMAGGGNKAIKAFEAALRAAIDGYRDSLKPDLEHPFFARIPDRYRLTFIASILKSEGWHPAHIHESAWLSGVYYVRVPEAVLRAGEAHEGWLEFGRPDFVLPEGFVPETAVFQPAEGSARFFPSYFYHGTIPFSGEGARIGIAFDAYPIS